MVYVFSIERAISEADLLIGAVLVAGGRAPVVVSDDMVASTMDVRSFATRKHRAIATHASQVDNADLVTMDEELFTLLFGIEYYQLAWSRDVTTGDETDLFGGL